MSQTDSFIEEVNEEVRQDRLYALARKYGWIVAIALIALVGATAFSEYRASQTEKAAQNRGDAILAALGAEDEAAQQVALSELAEKDGTIVTRLLAATGPDAATDLQAIANDTDQPDVIRELARLRLAAIPGALPNEDRLSALKALSAPGAVFQTPALDLYVLVLLETGDTEAAVSAMNAAIQDATTPRDQLNRFVELLVALGETPELANETDPATQN